MSSPISRKNLGYALAIVARRWRAAMDEQLSPLGLTQAKWLPMMHLSATGGSLPQRKLAERTGIEGPTLVRVLDELERLELIERRDGDADRRTKTIHLTRRAEPLLAELASRAERLRDQLLDGVSEQNLAVFCRVLGTISQNLERLAP